MTNPVPPTKEMAQYIEECEIGCRYGTDLNGAGYGLTDVDGNDFTSNRWAACVIRWTEDPATTEFEPLWTNRLWNTCGFIRQSNASGTILIIARALPSAERYSYDGVDYRGSGETFAKKGSVQNSQIVTRFTYSNTDDAAAIYNRIYNTLKGLASAARQEAADGGVDELSRR